MFGFLSSVLALLLPGIALASVPWAELPCDINSSHAQPEKMRGEYPSRGQPELPFTYVVKERNWDSGQLVVEDAQRTPTVAMRLERGWLLGADRGEWGGELAFAPDDGQAYVILEDAINDFWVLPFGVVALAGVAHMDYNFGRIYLIDVSGDPVTAKRLHGLPGAPRSSALLTDGSLLVHTTEGHLVLNEAGQLTPVRCGADG